MDMKDSVVKQFGGRMTFVTPIEFTKYFLSKFCKDDSRKDHARIKTVEVVMSTLGEEEQEQVEMQQENGGGDDDDDDDDHDELNYILVLIGNEMDNTHLNDHQNLGPNDHQDADIMNDIWILEIRHHAIDYILRTGQQFRFRVQTLYTSVMYVDRFLVNRIVNVGAYASVRLLSVTCLSLAAKMDETLDNVPLLSDYPVGIYDFIDVTSIRSMELMVLDDLNWDMRYVTPFDFIQFFLSIFCRDVSRRNLTRMRIDEIVMSVLGDVRLMNHRPSVVAAAATLLAVNRNLRRGELEIEINGLPLNGLLLIDNVWYCYNRLLQMNPHI